MMKKLLATIAVAGIWANSFSQEKKPDLTHIKFSVAEAPEWNALLKRNEGWFGGDGIYSIPLNGVEGKQASSADNTLFVFSDTMIGSIRSDSLQLGHQMIHNSIAILKGNKPVGNKMQFYWNKDDKGALSSFVPNTPNTGNTDYYWLGDGFVNQALNNNVYIFGYRMKNVSGEPFGFREVGNTLIRISKNDVPMMKNIGQMDTPFYLTIGNGEIGSYGAGIYVNTKEAGAPHPDGYIYVYGVKGLAKQLMVARVQPVDFEHFNKWTFYDGSKWVSDINAAATLTDGVSNELSVSALPDGRYALIFQSGGMGTDVAMRLGASPIGPFGPPIKLWDCKPDLVEKTFVVYNAKAHPSLSAPGELLISYNINSVEFYKDLAKHPNLYRPRFIKVKFN